jgi:type I restriction-modification system DNA methylase subunit
MSKNQYQSFITDFNEIARHKHRYDVFRDFVTLSALSLHNAINKIDSLEQEYLRIIKPYSKEDAHAFPRLLGHLVNLLNAKPHDVLGELYMELELGNKNSGQFFTPQHISEFMAQIIYDDNFQEHLNKPFIRLSEPACGAGGMVLAFVKIMIDNGHNPGKKLWVQCVDVDRLASLMCYVQLTLWNIPAEVIVGNSLTLEVREVFRTPAHYIGMWDTKLKQQAEQESPAEPTLKITKPNPLDNTNIKKKDINKSSVQLSFDF